jgi:hypothetical protein
MSDVKIDVTQTPISILPPARQTVLVQITAPGGFSGGVGVEAFQFTRNIVSVSIGGTPLTLDGSYTLESYTISCGKTTPPVGAAIICDINKNGATIFTNQAHRPTIPDGQTVGSTTAPDIVNFAAGDYITIDVDQVGSSSAGANLEINLRLRRIA